MRLPGSWVTRLAIFFFVLAASIALAGELHAQPRNATEGVSQSDAEASPQFAIMAGLFDEENAARVLADTLRDKGFNPYIFEGVAPDGGAVYAVRLDIFDSLLEALQAQAAFAKKDSQLLQITPGGSTEPINMAAMTFLVQTGVYNKEALAHKALRTLVHKGVTNAGMLPLDGSEDPDAPQRIIIHASIHGSYEAAAEAAAAFAKKYKIATSVNVVDTALYVSRHVDAKMAVPDAFEKKAEPPKKAAPEKKAAPKKNAEPPKKAEPQKRVEPNTQVEPEKKAAPKVNYTRAQPAPQAAEPKKDGAPKKDPAPKERKKDEDANTSPTPLPIPPGAFPPPETSGLGPQLPHQPAPYWG